MSTVLTIARKELRASFQSPVALIFLGIFLAASLYGFFGYAGFFARRIADLRPLFEWLPITLILLVAAVTMRQWAEEKKMGTLEVLVTLPVAIRDLVLGKFAAGLALVAIALAMTLPIPVMVAVLGPLDWGPVAGGYVAALLLASAYLSIGLCISARTDNQVVALMGTLVVAGGLYFTGSDRVTSLFGNRGADLLRSLGTGSRFESIERGVLDLRDLVYYLGLAAFALCLNWYFLEADRLDPASSRGRARRLWLTAVVALVAGNALALDLWLAPVTRARVDLTQTGEYSISHVTVDTLGRLAEPLRIDGYFSERTHPLLAPLVPQIRDLLREYEIHGRGRVRVGIADPNADEALESELNEEFQIRSVPFRVADRHQQAVVNSYFHILIRYGDQHASLGFDDLIDVYADETGIQVRLRNLEYDMTRAIKRVSQEFQNMEFVFSRLPSNLTFSLFVTPQTLPKGFAELPDRIRQVASELSKTSQGKLEYRELDPDSDDDLRRRLASEHGIRPLAVDLFGRETFYLDVLLEADAKAERIIPRSDLSESDLRVAIEAAIRRLTPGQLKSVGLLTEVPLPPPPNPNLPPQFQPPPRRPDYQILEQLLGAEYEITRVQLEDGLVPEVIDALLIAKAGALSEHQKFAIDQHLMRGGKVIVLTSHYEIRPERGGLTAVAVSSPLNDMLESWGVRVERGLLMDPQNAAFPVPVQEQRGGLRFQTIRMLPYPFFADMRRDGFAEDQPAFLGIENVTTPWASALELTPVAGLESQVLLSSSEGSWVNLSGEIDPDFGRYPELGFGPDGDLGSRVVGVTLTGRFPSYYAVRPSPLFEGSEAETADSAADRTGRTMKESLPDARLVVLGSPEMVSDLMMRLSDQPGGEVHRSNLQLVQNLVDWSLEDTDLLSIRSSGSFARTLRPMSETESRGWELGIYGATTLLLGGATLIPARRRGRARALAHRAVLDASIDLGASTT